MDIDVTFPGGKRVDAEIGGTLVHTDQPAELGGEASAPAPYDLVLASLATCAGIYALGFCQARSLPTEGLRLRQHVEFDPSTHLATEVRLEVTPPVGFPEKYRPALERALVATSRQVRRRLARLRRPARRCCARPAPSRSRRSGRWQRQIRFGGNRAARERLRT
jgi:ribosomal protein S12 methylthiotransferase accessory factor